MRRTTTVHQLEQRVQIDAILTREPLGQLSRKAGAPQALDPPPLPPLPIAGRTLGRLVVDTHKRLASLGAADLECR